MSSAATTRGTFGKIGNVVRINHVFLFILLLQSFVAVETYISILAIRDMLGRGEDIF